MSNLLRLRCSRHWGWPILLKRVNAHAKRRELPTSVLAILLSNSPIIEQQESKVDVLGCAKRPVVMHNIMSLYLFYFTIGYYIIAIFIF